MIFHYHSNVLDYNLLKAKKKSLFEHLRRKQYYVFINVNFKMVGFKVKDGEIMP